MENGQTTPEVSILTTALSLIYRNLLLIIIIMVISVGGGFAYSRLRKPCYTATESVTYSAEVITGTTESAGTTTNINAMRAYLQTVMDFCDTGVVLDRANSYYDYYQYKSGISLSAFISDVKNNPNEYPVKYDCEKVFTDKTVGYKQVDNKETQFSFKIHVDSYNLTEIKTMVRIYALAYDIEARDAFGGVTTYISELVGENSAIAITSDTSNIKIYLIAFAIGVLVSAGVVYLKYILNNTVTSEEELAQITGVNLLAYIEDTEVNK